MKNAYKFREMFGLYATELWAMSEKDFLEWLNAEADTPQTECRTCKWAKVSWTSHYCDDCKAHNKYEPNDTSQTESTGSPMGDYRDGVGVRGRRIVRGSDTKCRKA